jgi:outer membrane protein TolC
MKVTRWAATAILLLAVSAVAWCAVDDQLAPLGISEAVQLALQNAPELRQAELSLALAKLELEAAEYGSFLPAIGLSVDLPRLSAGGFSDEIGASLAATVPLPWGSGNVTASVGLAYDLTASSLALPTWQLSLSDLFDLAKPTSKAEDLASKKRAVDSATTSYATAENDLVTSTLKEYRTLLAEAQQAEQDSQTVDRLQSELDQVQSLIAQGYGGDQDLNQAQLALLDAQIQAQKSSQTYESDLESFCQRTLGLEENRQLEPLDLSMDDILAASHELLGMEIPESAIASSPAVISAQQGLDDATRALRSARCDALPSFSVKASVDASEWSVGVGVSFDLFAPDRWTQVKIAETQLAVAEQKLASAKQTALNAVLDQQTALLAATQNGERLALEQEKWQLEEQVTTAKHDAGSISDADWTDFLQQKNAFVVDADGRAAAVLMSYLTYRSALGLELNWEEWL